MHKLLEFICDELEEIERKAEKQGKLSTQEIQYMDTLLHAKKNLLTAEAMMEEEDGMSGARGRGRNARRDSMGRYSSRGGSNRSYDGSYEGGSNEGGSYGGGSYGGSYEGSYEGGSMARGGNRGGGGRSSRGYSSRDGGEELVQQLKELEMNAQDEETRRMIQKFIKQAEM